MTYEQIEKFKEDYFTKTGRVLTVDYNESPEKVNALINRTEMLIDSVITSRSPNYLRNKTKGQIPDFQKETIWQAMLEQIQHILTLGDFTMVSGIDPVTGGVIPLQEIVKRYFSPIVMILLKNAGLFYSGVGNPRRRGDYLV